MAITSRYKGTNQSLRELPFQPSDACSSLFINLRDSHLNEFSRLCKCLPKGGVILCSWEAPSRPSKEKMIVVGRRELAAKLTHFH